MKEQPKRDSYPTKWEELPCVILAEKIKQEKWATTTTIKLSNDQKSWEVNPYEYNDPQITLTIPYKTEIMTIYVKWVARNSKDTVVDKFKIETFCHNRRTVNIRPKTSKSFHGAISKIEDTIIQLLPSMDARIEKQIREKEWKEKLDSMKKELKSQLNDVKLDDLYQNSVEYRASPSYLMQINVDPDTPSLYRISNLRGQFTVDELHQIIKIVGTNPRAVAERLLKQSR